MLVSAILGPDAWPLSAWLKSHSDGDCVGLLCGFSQELRSYIPVGLMSLCALGECSVYRG